MNEDSKLLWQLLLPKEILYCLRLVCLSVCLAFCLAS